ncbi:MAG: FAD-binding protein [Deltaproteobacteria bacterium]|nr:FAD-binding protein [Deltaproteobacteria bacterium]
MSYPRVVKAEIFLGLEEMALAQKGEVDLRELAARALALHREDIHAVVVARRSLDARKGRPMGYRLRLDVHVGGVVATTRQRPKPEPVKKPMRVVVAGSGPAGTFAALRLAEAGVRVTLAELGKDVRSRRHDLAALVRRGQLDPTSNYCFGEGGAGTFSDGKLYTRAKDRARVNEVLEILVEHGADPSIQVESRPHIGSNKLPVLLAAMSAHLESLGVEYHWSDPVVGFRGDGGRVTVSKLRSGLEIPCDRLVLAVGHSARSTYEWLLEMGVAAASKPFAIGARVEHPQPLIDRIQYGAMHGHPLLPSAFYHVTASVRVGGNERGVYSFCMCPGGWIVDSSTEHGRLATNGMSLKRRDSPFANAALVVTVEPGDVAAWGRSAEDPLAGVAFQRAVEERAYELGGGGFVAPAQNLLDFLKGRATTTPGRSSYRPRVVGADLAEALPDLVTHALRAAIPRMDKTMWGFKTSEAQLVGVETRTSSPLRILRDSVTYESLSHKGLFPCGEGAGYAGGIVSAAIDGLAVADAILRGT